MKEVLKGGALMSSGSQENAYFVPKLYPVMPWGPAIDMCVESAAQVRCLASSLRRCRAATGLNGIPLDLIREGNFMRVPVIMGA